MSEIDTSTAAVQRLAEKFTGNAADWRWDADHHAAAATLTALAGERDAAEFAKAEAEALQQAQRERLTRERDEAEARGRRAGIEEAAKVADVAADLASPSDFQSNLNTALALAAAIRALTEPQA